MKMLKKWAEMVQSRKFQVMVAGLGGAYMAWDSVPKTPVTTIGFGAAVLVAVAAWITAQGRVDAAERMRPHGAGEER